MTLSLATTTQTTSFRKITATFVRIGKLPPEIAWDTHRRLLAWWIAPSLSFKAESCSERRGTTSWPTRHTSTSPTQPERSTQYYRERKRSYPDTHVSRRLKRRTGNLQRHWFKIRPLHTPFLFVCFLQSIAPAFFSFNSSTPQRNHQRSHLGV